MNKNDILDYVMNTPGNTNRAVLSSMLNSMEGSGSGGESTPDGPTFNDGKTRLFVTVASIDRPVIAIYFGCTVVGGVTIDWGDGSETEVTTSTERTRYSHSYSAAGDYIITLEVTDGELTLEGAGSGNSFFGIMTQKYDNPEPPYSFPYVIAALKRVEIGNSITSIGNGAFMYCSALTSVVIPSSVTSIGNYAFGSCFALTSVAIPSSVTSIGDGAFNNCLSLGGIHILSSTPPTLPSGSFSSIPKDCKIYIPAGSLEAYSTATNWSSYASMMVEE